MLRSRKTIDAAYTYTQLDELQAIVRREADGAQGDPFDEAMIAAVFGAAEALKAAAEALAAVAVRQGKLAREH